MNCGGEFRIPYEPGIFSDATIKTITKSSMPQPRMLQFHPADKHADTFVSCFEPPRIQALHSPMAPVSVSYSDYQTRNLTRLCCLVPILAPRVYVLNIIPPRQPKTRQNSIFMLHPAVEHDIMPSSLLRVLFFRLFLIYCFCSLAVCHLHETSWFLPCSLYIAASAETNILGKCSTKFSRLSCLK